MRKSPLFVSAFVALGTLICLDRASAATGGSDNAANYGTSWSNGDNKGTGFNAWNLYNTGSGGFDGFFIGDSTNLNGTNQGANINSSGSSFGMFGHDGTQYANAERFFAGGALTAGQSFSLDLAVNGQTGNKGIDIYTGSSGASTTVFTFVDASSGYSVLNTSATNGNLSNNTYNAITAFHLVFTENTNGNGGSWTIIRSGGITSTDTGTYSGAISGFHLFEGQAGNGAGDNLYANNFTVVPEPGTYLGGLALLAVGGSSFLRRRVKA